MGHLLVVVARCAPQLQVPARSVPLSPEVSWLCFLEDIPFSEQLCLCQYYCRVLASRFVQQSLKAYSHIEHLMPDDTDSAPKL